MLELVSTLEQKPEDQYGCYLTSWMLPWPMRIIALSKPTKLSLQPQVLYNDFKIKYELSHSYLGGVYVCVEHGREFLPAPHHL